MVNSILHSRLHNRCEAGQKLAIALEKYRSHNPTILGMPRGGVVVAYEIAHALRAPLDVMVTRKLVAPLQPEFAIGAIAPPDVVVWNEEARSYLELSEVALAQLIAIGKKEMQRRLDLYYSDVVPLDLKDKVVIVVDDGIATGQSILAGVKAVRKMQPQKIILAVGVAAIDSLAMLRPEVDEIICLMTPEPFHAVGLWYDEFTQIEDDEVIELLHRSREVMQQTKIQ